MAKDDNASPGIFSKVAKFVRNPGTNWTDLDEKESSRESAHSKQALKEMIERKRRNDFVRKREFDMLRKLRRREALGTPGVSDGSARPSFFQSSMPSKPDDRAMTLKKIDEIEAQMSMQWWKTKHGGGASSLPAVTSSFSNSETAQPAKPVLSEGAKALATHSLAYARTAPDDLTNALANSAARVAQPAPAPMQAPASFVPAPIAAPAPIAVPVAYRPLAPASPPVVAPVAPVRNAAPAANAPKAPMMGSMAGYTGGAGDAGSGFSVSKMFALEVGEVMQHDPELEEAAIRFANGDDAGAEAGLLEALSPSGSRTQHEETWFAVFDLYRATGQQNSFESLAIDFAGKFSRSAPMWFSMPDMVEKTANPDAIIAARTAQKSNWRSPPNFGLQSLPALNAALAKATMPWALDWSVLKTIEDNAVVPMRKLFASWANTAVKLRFIGAANLDSVLAKATPSNDATVSQDLWKLRLEQLRVTHHADEFEMAALDFCVTYEVSPPSWEVARCEYKSLDANGQSDIGQSIVGEAVHDSIVSEFSGYDDGISNSQSAHTAQLSQVELSGQIEGDPVVMLDKLEARFTGADVMVISCAKLMRVDFSAAGTLLNWVSAKQNEGRVVHFTDVHRLVASFFNVIGISEHARVTVRLG